MTDPHLPFLQAILARPEDDLPRLIYADWLEENATRADDCPTCGGEGIERYCDAAGDMDDRECRACGGIVGVRIGTGMIGGNGYADRAEFIRVQCELAKIKCTCRENGTILDTGPYGYGPRTFDPCTHCKRHALRRRERELLDRHRLAWLPTVVMDIEAQTFGPSHVYRRGFVEELTCSWSDCRAHLSAIRERTPIRKVRLTRSASDEVIQLYNTDGTERWPGIEFELPPRETIFRGIPIEWVPAGSLTHPQP